MTDSDKNNKIDVNNYMKKNFWGVRLLNRLIGKKEEAVEDIQVERKEDTMKKKTTKKKSVVKNKATTKKKTTTKKKSTTKTKTPAAVKEAKAGELSPQEKNRVRILRYLGIQD